MRLNPTNISIIRRLLVGRNNRPLKSILSRLAAPDLAALFSHLNNVEIRNLIDALISIDRSHEALLDLPESRLEELLGRLDDAQVQAIIAQCPESDGAFLLALVDDHRKHSILESFSRQKRTKLEHYLNYPEDSAGRLMIEKVFTLPADLPAGEAIDILRMRSREESIYYIYCVDKDDRLIGVVSLRSLVTAAPEKHLRELARKDIISVTPETPEDEVANLVSKYDFIALPVVDKSHRLLGLVTVDDIVDVIQEQATAKIYATAGLQEDDRVYTPSAKSFKNRIPWMFLNLILAAIASSVVSLFEQTMAQLIILASVKNIVAATGGNTAIQTLTVVNRGLATDDFQFITIRKALLKEIFVGVQIGIILGITAGSLIYLWKQDLLVAIVICISMILNSIVATGLGAITPIVLKKLNFDPAVSSGVLVTICTDIFGFFSFLGIASLGLKYLPQIVTTSL